MEVQLTDDRKVFVRQAREGRERRRTEILAVQGRPRQHPELHRLYERGDRKEQVIVPDSMVKRARVGKVMAEI